MALSPMAFSKVWTNPVDFPTHETQESQVRADIQYLFDEIKDQFNNLVANELVAANVPVEPSGDIPCDNVQDAIEYLIGEIQGLVLDELVLPDYSITAIKLHADAVTTDKIEDGAVTEDKIGYHAVTGDKINPGSINGDSFADGSIPEGKLGQGSVSRDNLKANCVSHEKLATDAVEHGNIKDGEVGENELAANAVTTDKILNGNVTADKLSTDAVINVKIANDAVTTAKILDGNVTAAKLATDAVITDKILDGNVTEAKLASALATKINGKLDKYSEATFTLAAGSSTWSKTNSNITANSLIYVSPVTSGTNGDRNFNQWTNFGIRPTSQGAGTITFKSRSATEQDCEVNVAIFNK